MGRPKEFDEDQAIAGALDVFWANGYSRASLSALEEETGLNRSSLYNTFGGKLELFCRALDAYNCGPTAHLTEPLHRYQGAKALTGFLDRLGEFVRSKNAERGCLMVNTSVEDTSEPEVHQRVQRHFRKLHAAFEGAYAQGLQDKSLTSSLTPAEAADWLLMFSRGLLVAAAAGESKTKLARSIAATKKQLGLRPI